MLGYVLGNLYNLLSGLRYLSNAADWFNQYDNKLGFCYISTLCTTQSALTIAASRSISASSSHATIPLGAASCILCICMASSHLRFASDSFGEVRDLFKVAFASTDFGFRCKLCNYERSRKNDEWFRKSVSMAQYGKILFIFHVDSRLQGALRPRNGYGSGHSSTLIRR